MPETAITREQLLASVLPLQDGDLLVIRVPKHWRSAVVQDLYEIARRAVGPGIRVLILTDEIEINAHRAGVDV